MWHSSYYSGIDGDMTEDDECGGAKSDVPGTRVTARQAAGVEIAGVETVEVGIAGEESTRSEDREPAAMLLTTVAPSRADGGAR
jgi:hypothetical protein